MRGVTGPIEEIILSVSRLKVSSFMRNSSTNRTKDVGIYTLNTHTHKQTKNQQTDATPQREAHKDTIAGTSRMHAINWHYD